MASYFEDLRGVVVKKLTRFIIDNGKFVRFYGDDTKYVMLATHRCATVAERDWLVTEAGLETGTMAFVESEEKLYLLKSTGWKVII